MATVVCAAPLLARLEALLCALRAASPAAAAAAAAAIGDGFRHLAAHPLVGRPLAGGLRELAISYGRTGYVALYRVLIARDEVRLLAIRSLAELHRPGAPGAGEQRGED